ncbi:arylsulfatase [uncultured Shimia sp.]|uniref:arylsulfatase n=1 Tax=uncultured Shimia sp. TaxID=573152 RepID=UPI00260CCA79|nr:arylsulfatase [uncultured Shimia sp.]
MRLILLLSLIATLSLFSVTTAAHADDKPNVVFIFLDNFGWGEPGFNGGGIIRGTPTPEMDALAAEGLRLTNFNVEAQCTPSRAATMTGRYGIRSGNHTVPLGGGVYGLTQWEVTMAEMLKDVGYDTAMYGKWHLGWSEGRYPSSQGFDEFYAVETTDVTVWPTLSGYADQGMEENVVMQGVAGEPATAARAYDLEYRAEIDGDLTEKAIDFINRKSGEDNPFFVYLAYTQTHYPNIAAKEFDGATGNGVWADILLQVDTYIGRVNQALEDAGVADNTIVIFTADNGPEALQVGSSNVSPVPAVQGIAGPWRGTLFTSLEGSMRVPFAIKWPGKIPAGSASNGVVHSMDLFPTLAAFAGGSVPKDRPFDGIDQSALFLGNQDSSNREGVIVYMGSQIFGVKWNDWKVMFKENSGVFGATETFDTPRIYNLLNDPHERDNVLFPYTWVAERAMPQLYEHAASFKEHPPIPPGTPDPYVPANQ